jgi:hypothetical protein
MCKSFTKNGLPNMRDAENRRIFLQKGRNKDGTPDCRTSENQKKINEYYSNLYNDS